MDPPEKVRNGLGSVDIKNQDSVKILKSQTDFHLNPLSTDKALIHKVIETWKVSISVQLWRWTVILLTLKMLFKPFRLKFSYKIEYNFKSDKKCLILTKCSRIIYIMNWLNLIIECNRLLLHKIPYLLRALRIVEIFRYENIKNIRENFQIKGIFHHDQTCYYQSDLHTNNQANIYQNQMVSTGPIYTQCNISQSQVENFDLYQKQQFQTSFYQHPTNVQPTDSTPNQITEVIHDLVGSERPSVIVQQNWNLWNA